MMHLLYCFIMISIMIILKLFMRHITQNNCKYKNYLMLCNVLFNNLKKNTYDLITVDMIQP